jgi:membrane-bound lytic murein transglycosylase A
MDRIRSWMLAYPQEARDLRRQNRSFVFFRAVGLGDEGQALGAQGIELAPWRSIAVDKALHAYGTPFFIEADLPIASTAPTTPFRRLMIAQDTGSAIVGPARADLFFGAGDEAGRISGRMRHQGRFTMLVPRDLDPAIAVGRVPLPRPAPQPKIVEPKPEPAAAPKG